MKCPQDWECYRRPDPGGSGDMGDRCHGYLVIPKRQMAIVFSASLGWEHVSISHPDRCPSWEEIKRRFWQPEDVVMQLHVAVSEHKSFHPYCLHLWRPLEATIPLPPSYMVAP